MLRGQTSDDYIIYVNQNEHRRLLSKLNKERRVTLGGVETQVVQYIAEFLKPSPWCLF